MPEAAAAGPCGDEAVEQNVVGSESVRLAGNKHRISGFSDHDRAVVNHAVGVNSSGTPVAVRWYELYDPREASL